MLLVTITMEYFFTKKGKLDCVTNKYNHIVFFLDYTLSYYIERKITLYWIFI